MKKERKLHVVLHAMMILIMFVVFTKGTCMRCKEDEQNDFGAI